MLKEVVIQMPSLLDDEFNKTSTATLSFLLKSALKNYEIVIAKYETFLVEVTSLNGFIKDKLLQLPTEVTMQHSLKEFIDKSSEVIKAQNDKMDIIENLNKSERNELIGQLNTSVQRLLYRLKIVIVWLSVITVVGAGALGFIQLVLSSKISEQTKYLIKTREPINDHRMRSYWIDDNGVKRYIYFEEISNSDQRKKTN